MSNLNSVYADIMAEMQSAQEIIATIEALHVTVKRLQAKNEILRDKIARTEKEFDPFIKCMDVYEETYKRLPEDVKPIFNNCMKEVMNNEKKDKKTA